MSHSPVSRTQAAMLDELRQLSHLLETPGQVPMRAAYVLCQHHFSSAPLRVLTELKRQGYLSFQEQEGTCVLVRRAMPEDVLPATPKPIPLPQGTRSLQRLSDAIHASPNASLSKFDLGRETERDAPEED